MSNDKATFGLELLDKVSGPSERIIGGLEGATSAIEKLGSSSGGMTKTARAAEILTVGLRGLQIAHGIVELTKSLGGIEAVRSGILRAGQAVRQFGTWAVTGLRKVAPFAAGGAGLYGIGKIATAVTIPAMGATTAAIGGIGLAAGAATLAVGYLGLKLAGLAMEGVKSVAGWAVFGENSRSALNALAKYGSTGEGIFQHVRGLSDEYGLSVRDATNNYRDLLASDFAPKMADDITKMGADMRFLGKSAEQVKLAVIGISQIKATGNLQGDELNQVANAIGLSKGAVWDQIAKSIGKSREEVLKLKNAGKLDQGVAIEGILGAVTQLTRAPLGERGKEWANSTIEGFVSRIKSKGEGLMVDLGDRLTPSLQRLAQGAFVWVDSFIQSGKAAALIGSIGDTFDAVGRTLIKIQPLVGKFLDAFSGEAVLIFQGISSAVNKLGGGDGMAAGLAFEQMGKGLAQVVIYGGAAAAAVGAFAATVTGVLVGSLDALFGLPARAIGIGFDMAMGVARGLRDGVLWVVEAVQEMADAAVNKLRGALDIRSPSKVFGQLGSYTAIGFAAGIVASSGAAADASFGMARGAVDATQGVSYSPIGGSPVGDYGQLSAPMAGLPSSAISVSYAPMAPALTSPMQDGALALGGGGGSFSFSLTQHIEGGGLDANQVAEISVRKARSAFEDFIRQLDSEA